jgi:hypothetical protein
MSETVHSEDPYRTVLFSDIRDLLMQFNSSKHRIALKRIWLSLIGLSVPGFDYQLLFESDSLRNLDDWARSDLRKPAIIDSVFPRDSDITTSSVSVDGLPSVEHKSSFGFLKNWSANSLELIRGIEQHGHYRLWEVQDVSGIDLPFVRNLLALLSEPGDLEWYCLNVAFEAAMGWKQCVPCNLDLRADRHITALRSNHNPSWKHIES